MIRIEAPYFVAGVTFDQTDKVISAAPIVRYMLGWPYTRVIEYCRFKKWKITNL